MKLLILIALLLTSVNVFASSLESCIQENTGTTSVADQSAPVTADQARSICIEVLGYSPDTMAPKSVVDLVQDFDDSFADTIAESSEIQDIEVYHAFTVYSDSNDEVIMIKLFNEYTRVDGTKSVMVSTRKPGKHFDEDTFTDLFTGETL